MKLARGQILIRGVMRSTILVLINYSLLVYQIAGINGIGQGKLWDLLTDMIKLSLHLSKFPGLYEVWNETNIA